MSEPVDYETLWAANHPDEDWLVNPILPRGRAIVTYSSPKVGKSLFALDVAARLATGRRCMDNTPSDPINVMYLDLEMGEADLRERLLDMDYGPHSDLEHLTYYCLPDLEGLDTPKGGKAVRAMVDRHHPALVVIDTVTTGIVGPENDADTYRAFWRHTGSPLKDQGITVWRLDHAGKDLARGMRGSSAKAGDPDLVWELSEGVPGELRLKATHRRMSWVPQLINLIRLEYPTRHELSAGQGWPPGTHETAIELDRHQAPVDISNREASKILRANGWSGRNETLAAAIRWRKQTLSVPHPGNAFDKTPGQRSGTGPHLVLEDGGGARVPHDPSDDLPDNII